MNNAIISIGHGNFLPSNKILALLYRETRAIKPIISKAELNDKLINATKGRKLKTVILTTDGYVVLSAVTPRTLAKRYAEEEGEEIMSAGGENFIPNKEITAILQRDPAPIKEMIKVARAQDRVVSAAMGRKTKSVVATSSGYIFLSYLSPKTLSKHYHDNRLTVLQPELKGGDLDK